MNQPSCDYGSASTMYTNHTMNFSVSGERSPRRPGAPESFRESRLFPAAFFATDLKLGRFPTPHRLPSRLCLDHSHRPVLAPATLAALPSTPAIPDRMCSMSLIPSAPFTDLYRSIGLGRTRTKSAVNLQLDPSSAQRFVSIRVHSWLQLILRPARVRIQGGQIGGITSRLFPRRTRTSLPAVLTEGRGARSLSGISQRSPGAGCRPASRVA